MTKRLNIALTHHVFHKGDTHSLCGMPDSDIPADPEGNARALDAKVAKYGCIKCLRLLIKEYDEAMAEVKRADAVVAEYLGLSQEEMSRAAEFIKRLGEGRFQQVIDLLFSDPEPTNEAEPEPADWPLPQPAKKAASRPRKTAAKKTTARKRTSPPVA
jgi:hypothetical protein